MKFVSTETIVMLRHQSNDLPDCTVVSEFYIVLNLLSSYANVHVVMENV